MFGYCNPLQPCTLRYKRLSAFNRRSIAYVRGKGNIDNLYLFIHRNVLKKSLNYGKYLHRESKQYNKVLSYL